MNVCVFGLWHLGSVTSACLAKLGHKVIGLDLDKNVIKGLQDGRAPLFEPELDKLILRQMQEGRLSFTNEPSEALQQADIVWITFDTPVDENDVANIGYLEENFQSIISYLRDGIGIVVSSQAPVGFVNKISKLFKQQFPNKKCYFACSPENLRLGKAIDIFLNPDRIIVGVENHDSKDFFFPLFSSITDKLEWMKIESAEMTKHAINSFLAMSVCFANEIASICECVGAEAKEVARGLKTEERIGPKAYLNPGVAFSGGTLARDVNFLMGLNCEYKLPGFLIKAINDSNSFHKSWVERKCQQFLGNLKNKNIAILGLTYKPRTDTLRRSFAVDLAKKLYAQGAVINGFDPVIKVIPQDIAKIISLKHSVDEAILNSDVIIIATEWPEFKQFSDKILKLMENKFVIDPNGFIVSLVSSKNIKYISVGSRYIAEAGK